MGKYQRMIKILSYGIVILSIFSCEKTDAVYCKECFSWECFCDSPPYPDYATESCQQQQKPEPVFLNNCCQGWVFGIEYLHWTPCISGLDYAIVKKETGNSPYYKYKTIDPDSENGYRLRIEKQDFLCNIKWSGSFTSLGVCSSKKTKAAVSESFSIISPYIQADDLIESNIHSLEATYDASYRSWDILVSYDLLSRKCFHASPFAGVEGLIFNQELETDIYTTSLSIAEQSQEWKADLSGFGLKIGTEFLYEMPCNFATFGTFSGSALFGSPQNVKNSYFTRNLETGAVNQDTHTYKEDASCYILPGFHFQLGISYSDYFCCTEIDFRLGYEYLYWLNLPKPRQFESGLSQTSQSNPIIRSSSSTTAGIGMHGLFLGIDLNY